MSFDVLEQTLEFYQNALLQNHLKVGRDVTCDTRSIIWSTHFLFIPQLLFTCQFLTVRLPASLTREISGRLVPPKNTFLDA